MSDPAEGWGAAAHRFTGTPDPLEEGARMFTFRGHHPRTGPPRHLSYLPNEAWYPPTVPFPSPRLVGGPRRGSSVPGYRPKSPRLCAIAAA